MNPDKIINHYVNRLSSKWEVINRTDKGIQIKKIRKFNMIGFWVGLILLPFWGIGVIFWFLAIFDYMWQFMAGDKIKFVTVDRMVEQLKVNE
jgi:hypothetical protein